MYYHYYETNGNDILMQESIYSESDSTAWSNFKFMRSNVVVVAAFSLWLLLSIVL